MVHPSIFFRWFYSSKGSTNIYLHFFYQFQYLLMDIFMAIQYHQNLRHTQIFQAMMAGSWLGNLTSSYFFLGLLGGGNGGW